MNAKGAITSVGHGFAIAYHDVMTFFKGVASKGPSIAATAGKDIATIGPLANVVIGGIDPALLPVARGAEAILGEVFAEISKAGDAATQNGVVVTIGADLVSGLKEFVAYLEGHPAVQVAQASDASTSGK